MIEMMEKNCENCMFRGVYAGECDLYLGLCEDLNHWQPNYDTLEAQLKVAEDALKDLKQIVNDNWVKLLKQMVNVNWVKLCEMDKEDIYWLLINCDSVITEALSELEVKR